MPLSLALANRLAIAVTLALFLDVNAASSQAPQSTASRAQQQRPKLAAAAFQRIVPVLRHPRCMNCHSPGDYPRQGDDRHVHSMQIRRGPDGHGQNGVQCSSCHQTQNVEGVHAPPGAPGWHLPPSDMPMIWEGLTDGQLCELLKDPNRNGHKTVRQIVEHMETPLVLWGWQPGEGRTPVPTPVAEFLKNVKAWEANGAGCPAGLPSSSAGVQPDARSVRTVLLPADLPVPAKSASPFVDPPPSLPE